MKVSVSLPDEHVEVLDSYVQTEGFQSRSAVLHKAVRLLRGTKLPAAYEDAFQDWERTGEERDWEVTANDCIGQDAAR